MKSSITTTLSKNIYDFLCAQARKEELPKNSIIEKALKIYQKFQLEKAIKEGLKERQKEYVEIAHDFSKVQAQSIKD